MRVAIAGASGFVGTALVNSLRANRHEVVRLTRQRADAADEIHWNPSTGELAEEKLTGIDAVISLSGTNVAAGRWTAKRRTEIRSSRVAATETLVHAMARMKIPPAVFLSASAVGYYGSRGEEMLTEYSPAGRGFLANVCVDWEKRANEAELLGVRTVLLRFGVVLSERGGALAKLRPIFRAGLGGRLGPGRQWMSWVGLSDAVRAIEFAMTNSSVVGALNVVAAPVRNHEFTARLAAALRRPAILPAPGWALRMALGKMADEMLLASVRAMPAKLEAAGFKFQDRDLAAYFGRTQL